MIRILIVDDQKTIHEVLRSYLETEPDIKIVGSAVDGQVALQMVEELKPDLVLMDLDMPVMDGLTATKIISERFVTTKVLIFTVQDDDNYLYGSLQAGAKGYFLKTTSAKELVNAIRHVHQGYFQLGLDLIEKYIHKVLSLSSNLNEIYQLNKRLDLHEKEMTRFSNNLKNIQIKIEQVIDKDLGKILKENRDLFGQDTKIEFRLDRLNQQINTLEKKRNFPSKFIWMYPLALTVLNIVLISLLLRQN
jgi:DNA-binding NarL/FixJ family response regulator